MKHTLALLVVNRPTVLSHIAGLISRRAFNIVSIAAGPTEDPKVTRITLVVECGPEEIEQVIKQLAKLVDIIKITNLTSNKSINRELTMIKVKAAAEKRTDIVDIVNIFRAKIVDVNRETMVIELTGETDKIDALLEVLQEHGIIEIVRTGKIALGRGPEAARDMEE
ncbi:acetolactate synthase small subunit [Metallumcola ferriviriculae]|uniref:Acetolactate synthase small subunit n=1 Tax=Metallumcola ferriviriculae TaxID=3039180 RepID=A0AAU0UJ34_9FIRM|nr:acetolactate synthase small subunit [Desulfitibacteraceae bacterium MK1]